MIKRFLSLILGAFILTGTGWAQKVEAPASQRVVLPQNPSVQIQKPERKDRKHSNGINLQSVENLLEVKPIITVPQGDAKQYFKNVTGYESAFGPYSKSDLNVNLYFDETTGDVYFPDIYSQWAAGSYVKGHLDNGKISVSLPQTIIYWDRDGYGMNLVIVKKTGENQYEIANIDTATFTYDSATGNITLDLPGDDYALGVVYTDNGGLVGCDFTQEYILDTSVNSLPAGITMERYLMRNDNNYGYPVYVGFANDKIYIKGLSYEMPSGVLIGTIDGNIASIAQNQNMGQWSFMNYTVYSKVVYMEDGEFVLGDPSETYNLNIDFEKKEITSANPGQYLSFNVSESQVLYMDIFKDMFFYQSNSFAGTPANPFNLSMDDKYLSTYGFHWFGFEIPTVSTEGNVLDFNDLYYRIYVDGELLHYYPSEDADYTVTETAFTFNNTFDCYKYSNIGRYFGVYIEDLTTLGVQSVYRYNDTVTESQIVTLNVETGEVTVNGQGSGVASQLIVEDTEVVYYDLNGRRINNPERGIYIKVQNGKATKVVL